MHSIEGHISLSHLQNKHDIQRHKEENKLKVKRFPLSISLVILLWKTPPQEIIAPRKFTMDIYVDIRNRAFMSDNNKLWKEILNFVASVITSIWNVIEFHRFPIIKMCGRMAKAPDWASAWAGFHFHVWPPLELWKAMCPLSTSLSPSIKKKLFN